jgi:hypothetical protein
VAGTLGSLALWMFQRSAEGRAEHLMSDAALAEILEQARRCADRYGRGGTARATRF